MKYILLFIGLVIILSYFNVDLRSIVEAPQTQKNIAYMTEVGQKVWEGFLKPIWDNYLSEPVLYFWQNIFVDILWRTFTESIDILKAKSSYLPVPVENP